MRPGKMWWAARLAVLMAAPALATAAGTSVRFDLSNPNGGPFPSDRFTKVDWTQQTFRRVNLPKPDCVVLPSDCADIDVINTLDGFNTQPRITVPFSGPIDPATVNSDTVYLVNLGDTLSGKGYGQKVGINQVAWDVASNTLVFESDELLAEHSRYMLVITDGVRDAAGDRIEAGRFGRFHRGEKHRHDHHNRGDRDDDDGDRDYGKSLRDGMHSSRAPHHRVAALSVFTTQSATADLRKIHRQIKHSRPAPVNFSIANGGTARAVFPLSGVAGIQFRREVGVTTATPTGFAESFLPTPALNVVAGSVASVAFGKFTSPDYQTAGKLIPATGTLSGHPHPQGSNELVFELFVPAGDKPAGGWPVAIFGHGFTDSMYGAPWTVASVFASKGIATIAINVVGHGGGAKGTLAVIPNVAGALPSVVPAGGRGFDQDGNGAIDSTEGVNAAAPATIVGSRDGLRQTVVDLMQLVRQIEVGVDVDGDGQRDLDKHRVYYAGQSFGGIYGTIFLGVEDGIEAGVPNVPGGSITEIARLGAFRGLTGLSLALRQPQLLNLAPTAALPVPFNFNENIPLRDLPTVINNVPGATAIQQLLDRNEWVQQAGNPVSYASLIRKDPPRGHAAKPVIFQVAKGDSTVPNPTSSAIVRAGDLSDRLTYFRNDLAVAQNPFNNPAAPGAVPKNAHTFLTNIGAAQTAPFAVMAQTQIAIFFASRGTMVVDPDGTSPFFEVPIGGPLPEGLNYIP